tara:strand:+ start:792 stop:1202 length:411 start_codon:yes stop_codon:yes gene_type:complete
MVEQCGGCKFHSYPYEAQLPVMVNGEYETRTFTCDEDVWDVVDLIIEETKEISLKQNKDFSIASSVKSQLPFFACSNIVYDKQCQKDIQRYIYSENFGIQPYSGSYGDQPSRWVQKSFIIKKALNKVQEKAAKDVK